MKRKPHVKQPLTRTTAPAWLIKRNEEIRKLPPPTEEEFAQYVQTVRKQNAERAKTARGAIGERLRKNRSRSVADVIKEIKDAAKEHENNRKR